MMNMPLKGMHYVFGWAVSGVVSIVFEMIPLIVIFLLTSFHLLTVKSILSFLGIALMMAFGTYGFAEILMGFAIYFKEADQFISLIANIAPFLGGLYFPVIQLPTPFLAISLLFPFTWGLDLVRNLLFGSSLILPLQCEIIVFVIVNVLYTFAGTKIYDAMMKKARKNGLSKFKLQNIIYKNKVVTPLNFPLFNRYNLFYLYKKACHNCGQVFFRGL